MILKPLGNTGWSIPEVGLGTWDYRAGPEVLRVGLEAGALFIDTAESYGSEEVVGQAVRGIRDRVFLATKVSAVNARPADLRRSAEASLCRLGVETIDLYQLHEPNPEVPIEETMGAMAELVDAGKVKFVGVSNFTVPQLRAAQAALGKYPVVSNQVRYSLIDRTVERGLLAYCQANNITVIAYSPLARGLDRIHDCDSSGVLESIARSTGKSVAQIAVNWCLCHDGVVAIPKGNTAEHVLEICGSSDWRLDDEQMQALNSRVLFRHRNALDAMIRRLVPSSARKIALKAVKLLPRSIRSRIR